jgi:hypothetical protein
MNSLSKFLTYAFCGSIFGVSYLGAHDGVFLSSERDARVIAESEGVCPPGVARTASGTCRRSHRSYFYGSNRGGSYGHGK